MLFSPDMLPYHLPLMTKYASRFFRLYCVPPLDFVTRIIVVTAVRSQCGSSLLHIGAAVALDHHHCLLSSMEVVVALSRCYLELILSI